LRTKILIVDDLKENILALSQLIMTDEVEIFTADSPDRALDLILDHEFALALLDVMMPTMSGFELARLIRGVERSRHMPIIFVTAHQMEQSVIFEGYESGAVDVLFKPLNPHIVRSKVAVFVRLDQQSKQLQSQVQTMLRLKEEAESANIAKSRFLANMSHEIRTPLSSVLGFADVLSQGGLSDEERAQSLSSISRNGQLLLRIIDDILDLSRIEAERVVLEHLNFDLVELLKDLEATLSNKALEKGISLIFTFDRSEKNSHFVSDPLRLKQILLNVIGNAIKFTAKGSVKVAVECAPHGADANTHANPHGHVDESKPGVKSPLYRLQFSVTDTGIGLTTDEARRIFEPFAQADGSTKRKFGGTGLGLAIAKQMARAMGGDVLIEKTEKNKGSVFVVSILAELAQNETQSNLRAQAQGELPNRQSASSEVSAQLPPAGASLSAHVAPGGALLGKRVLVVDDVLDNRVLIQRYLKPAGAIVEVASGGQEAIDRAFDAPWDVILMDIQMPTMDGYEATMQLRKLGFQQPIFALTAHAMREELERCLKAGCNGTLTKPVSRKDLIETLSTLLK
jgi:signal transduction histidine kinase